MFQNGDFPITREQMAKSSREDFGLPTFNGITMPKAAPAAAGHHSAAHQTANQAAHPPSASAAAGSAAAAHPLPPPAAYMMIPEEKLRYDTLFASYDTDNDGFLQGGEAVAVFAQAGLDIPVLRSIWALADDDKDGKLSALEFAVAFHIIVCVSKKGLPVPPGLPAPMRAFLASGGALPEPGQGQGQGQARRPPPAAAGPAAQAPAPRPRMSVGDAFGDIPQSSPAPQSSGSGAGAGAGAGHGGISDGDSDEVAGAVIDLTTASKKLVVSQNAALEVGCYAMLCYAMLCYAILCYAMLCYDVLCYAML
jgi:hypothetical protein